MRKVLTERWQALNAPRTPGEFDDSAVTEEDCLALWQEVLLYGFTELSSDVPAIRDEARTFWADTEGMLPHLCAWLNMDLERTQAAMQPRLTDAVPTETLRRLSRPGSNNHLTPETRAAIATDYATGAYTYKRLAARYGISESAACAIVNRRLKSQQREGTSCDH